jgi:hypothetical protein
MTLFQPNRVISSDFARRNDMLIFPLKTAENRCGGMLTSARLARACSAKTSTVMNAPAILRGREPLVK